MVQTVLIKYAGELRPIGVAQLDLNPNPSTPGTPEWAEYVGGVKHACSAWVRDNLNANETFAEYEVELDVTGTILNVRPAAGFGA